MLTNAGYKYVRGYDQSAVYSKKVKDVTPQCTIDINVQVKDERYGDGLDVKKDSQDDVARKIQAANKIEKDFKQIRSKAIEAVADDAVNMGVLDDLGITRNQLKKELTLYNVYIDDADYAVFLFDETAAMYYHMPSVEYSIKDKKFHYVTWND